MAKVVTEKMKPRFRRFSTGNSAISDPKPLPLPNHLRASIGSCHDFCKYGHEPDFRSEPISLRQEKLKKSVSETSSKRSKIPRMKELKPKPQPVEKHPNKTFLKSRKNEQVGRNDAGKGVIRPLASSFVTIRSKNSRLVNSKESIFQEKIIHVVEPKDEDHANKTRVPIKENDSKLKMKNGKALELKAASKDQISLNKNVKDETAGNISKNKVKALVDAFETLINN